MKEGFKLSKIEEVRTAMYAAMKAKDKTRKEAISALVSAVKKAGIDAGDKKYIKIYSEDGYKYAEGLNRQ